MAGSGAVVQQANLPWSISIPYGYQLMHQLLLVRGLGEQQSVDQVLGDTEEAPLAPGFGSAQQWPLWPLK